jgi:hypothetical protein
MHDPTWTNSLCQPGWHPGAPRCPSAYARQTRIRAGLFVSAAGQPQGPVICRSGADQGRLAIVPARRYQLDGVPCQVSTSWMLMRRWVVSRENFVESLTDSVASTRQTWDSARVCSRSASSQANTKNAVLGSRPPTRQTPLTSPPSSSALRPLLVTGSTKSRNLRTIYDLSSITDRRANGQVSVDDSSITTSSSRLTRSFEAT